MDFNTEILAGNLITRFKKALSLPDLTIGDVYAILRWNGIKPIRFEKRVNSKEATPVFSKYTVDGLFKNYNGLVYSRNRILQAREEKERAIADDIAQEIRQHELENQEEHEPTERERMQQASDELLRQQEVYFNESKDDELYQKMFGKKVYLTEKQLQHIKEQQQIAESKHPKSHKNDEGEIVPEKCPECGSKIKIYIEGEPIYKCSNKQCNKYFGTMPFSSKKVNEKDNNGKRVYLTEAQIDYIKKHKADSINSTFKKEVKKDGDKITIKYSFGKNGQGITDELLKIGGELEELAKEYSLFLSEPFFDTLDDVYDFTVVGGKKNSKESLKEAIGRKNGKIIQGSAKNIAKQINEAYVQPQKVLLVKNYLDNNFVKASMPVIGNDGYPTTQLLVGMKATDGEIAKNMTAKQLFYLLQDKFKNIYADKQQRDNFLKQVMKDWYNGKISREGLLSKNKY